jgi:hypothetical protein
MHGKHSLFRMPHFPSPDCTDCISLSANPSPHQDRFFFKKSAFFFDFSRCFRKSRLDSDKDSFGIHASDANAGSTYASAELRTDPTNASAVTTNSPHGTSSPPVLKAPRSILNIIDNERSNTYVAAYDVQTLRPHHFTLRYFHFARCSMRESCGLSPFSNYQTCCTFDDSPTHSVRRAECVQRNHLAA